MFFVTINDKTTKKQVVQKFPTRQQADKSAEAFRMMGYKFGWTIKQHKINFQ